MVALRILWQIADALTWNEISSPNGSFEDNSPLNVLKWCDFACKKEKNYILHQSDRLRILSFKAIFDKFVKDVKNICDSSMYTCLRFFQFKAF